MTIDSYSQFLPSFPRICSQSKASGNALYAGVQYVQQGSLSHHPPLPASNVVQGYHRTQKVETKKVHPFIVIPIVVDQLSYMTVQGIHPQQISQPPHSQSRHPAFGPVGFTIEEVELLEEVGRTELTGSEAAEETIASRIVGKV